MSDLYECTRCYLLKTVNMFVPSAARRRSWVCRACTRERVMLQYAENKAYTDRVKMERGCADCGYRGHPTALQFDHLPGYKKRARVSIMLGSYPLHVIIDEITKCEVVCGNCHAIRTHERGSVAAHWERWRTEMASGGVVKESPALRLFEDSA